MCGGGGGEVCVIQCLNYSQFPVNSKEIWKVSEEFWKLTVYLTPLCDPNRDPSLDSTHSDTVNLNVNEVCCVLQCSGGGETTHNAEFTTAASHTKDQGAIQGYRTVRLTTAVT